MKRLIFFAFLLAIVFFSRMTGCSPEKDPVNNTNDLNEQLAEDKLTNRDVANLLVKLADAHMTDAQEGSLAAEKGSTRAVKDYGKLMMKDQKKFLSELKKLAEMKNVTLPPAISHKNARGRNNLADKTGKDFDQKYIKMMTADHERDIKLLRKALSAKDADVRVFAQKHLLLVQSHLEKIHAIE
jgi:putative membrane protein